MTSRASRFARHSVALIRIGGVALLLGALGYRLGVFGLGAGFGLFGVGVLLCLVAAILAGIGLLLGRREPGAVRPAGVTLVIALAVLAVPIWTIIGGGGAPAIHHITTDPDDPPQFAAVIPLRGDDSNPLEYTPELAATQRRAYPDIQPVLLTSSPNEAFDRSVAAVEALGWELVDADRDGGRVEATDTTFWFGFKDDVVVRIRPSDGGSRIDLRSVSRVGGGDLGANAARIRAFMRQISGD